MRRLVFLIVGMACTALATALAQAGGLSYGVDSFKKAQELSKQNPSKHVLVFYTAQTRS
jgi:hypothetical protein